MKKALKNNDELKAKFLKGYDDIDAGNANDAEDAFKNSGSATDEAISGKDHG